MTVKIIYNEECLPFQNKTTAYLWENFPKISVETYDESHYKDRKKAITIKASCGARLTPFVSVYDDNKELIKAFYSETGDCVFDNIINYLNGKR